MIAAIIAVLILSAIHRMKCIESNCSQHQKCSNHPNFASSSAISPNQLILSNSMYSMANQLKSQTLTSIETCSCEADCHIYGDCCLDAQLNSTSLTASKYSCKMIVTSKNGILLLNLVSKCSQSWSQNNTNDDDYINEIQSQCEESNSRKHEADLFLSVPITSNQTNITYKNIYCAVCNFDVQHAEAWRADTLCSKMLNGTCDQLTFHKPQYAQIRHCRSSTVLDSCPNKSALLQESINCSLYYAPVRTTLGGIEPVTYKNKYCAACNNVSFDRIHCPKGRAKSPPTRVFGSGYSFSFSILLDINFSGGSIVGTKEKCSENHVFDPWKKTCRRVFCPPNSFFRDGDCIKYDKNNTQFKFRSLDSCPKIELNPEEYLLLNNERVFLKENNVTLNKSQYDINSYTKVLTICILTQSESFEGKSGETHEFLTVACLLISIICLAVKIGIFFCRPEPRRVSSILVLFLSLSLIAAHILFLVALKRIRHSFICQVIGITMHYSFLASFFWMNILSYDIYHTFASMLIPKSLNLASRQLNIYCMYGWGFPLLITSGAIIAHHVIAADDDQLGLSPAYGTAPHCWISNRLALTVFFAIPLGVLIIINSGLLILTAIKITRVSRSSRFARENINQRQERFRFVLYIKLATIMGSTWIIGFIAAYVENSVLWGLFIVLNSLQGLYVLLGFTHFRIANLLPCCRIGASRRASTKSMSTSSTAATRL